MPPDVNKWSNRTEELSSLFPPYNRYICMSSVRPSVRMHVCMYVCRPSVRICMYVCLSSIRRQCVRAYVCIIIIISHFYSIIIIISLFPTFTAEHNNVKQIRSPTIELESIYNSVNGTKCS